MSDSDFSFLGLSHNPFLKAGDAFYPGGQRKRLLDQLSHLSQWSRRSLLVTGVQGSGKTTLFDHLSTSMEPKALAAKVHGEVATSKRDVLAAVAKGFGVDVPEDAQADVLDELVRSFVELQQRSERLCVVLVDDAHRLDSRAIEVLLRLSLDCKVRIVMFAEPNVSRMVEEIGANLDIACHETQLIGFGQADVRGYLEWRFEQANYRGRVPFTETQVDTIAKVSSGLPGRIDELAGQELQRLSTGEPEEAESSFPVTHRLLVGMLVVVFGLLYLLVSGGDDETTDLPPPELATISVDTPAENGTSGSGAGGGVSMQPASELANPTQRPNATPLPMQQPNRQARVVQPALPVSQADTQELEAKKTAAAKVSAAKVAAAKAAAAAAERKAQLQREAEEQERLRQEARAEARRVATAKAAADAEAAKAAEQAAAAELAEQAAKQKAEQEAQQAAARQAANPARTAVSGAISGGQSERWLLQQNPQSFTLQLFTLSSAEGAVRYINRQQQPERFATYTFRRAGKKFHVVVYGLYTSKAAASAASVQLPASMDVQEPWIRPLGQIQATIRAAPAA